MMNKAPMQAPFMCLKSKTMVHGLNTNSWRVDGTASRLFGHNVEISQNSIVVSARTIGDGGLVYIFERLGQDDWSESRFVTPRTNAVFGVTVALNGDVGVSFDGRGIFW